MARAALAFGDTIAGYPLGELLGEGGAGAVHATTGPAGERLAIKLVAHGGDASLRVRSSREAEALMRIAHPNVLALVDAGADATWSFIVAKRLDGTTLRDLLQAKPLLPELAALVVRDAARGAGAIHRAGFCHRDLKPDNIMITDDGRVVIIDLGLALATDWTRQTREGSVAGSLPYMAPEQIDGETSPRSDVWSLGVTWWELVTGTRPFARARAVEEVAAIVAGSRAKITDVDRRIDPASAALLERCLSATERPDDGDHLATAIASDLGAATLRRLRHDRAALETELAARIARRCAVRALELTTGGDVFAAMREIDRGLAYRPGDRDLEALLASTLQRGSTASAAPPTNDATSAAAGNTDTSVSNGESGTTTTGSSGAGSTTGTGSDETASGELAVASTTIADGSRWRLVIAATILAAGAITAALLLTRDREPPPLADNFDDPRALVQTLIDAARSGHPGRIAMLCHDTSHPEVERLCDAVPGGAHWPYLRAGFHDAIIDGVYHTPDGAVVNLRFGPGATERGTLELRRRDGRFYLHSF